LGLVLVKKKVHPFNSAVEEAAAIDTGKSIDFAFLSEYLPPRRPRSIKTHSLCRLIVSLKL
jgi:hypothetical protein